MNRLCDPVGSSSGTLWVTDTPFVDHVKHHSNIHHENLTVGAESVPLMEMSPESADPEQILVKSREGDSCTFTFSVKLKSFLLKT